MEHHVSLKRNAWWKMGLSFLFAGCVILAVQLATDGGLGGAAASFIFFGVGGFMAGRELLRKRNAERLMDSGRYVWGQVTAIKEDTTVRYNKQHPYRLVVRQETPGGDGRLFESHSLFLPWGVSVMGAKVRVYISSENPEKYYVDTDGILS